MCEESNTILEIKLRTYLYSEVFGRYLLKRWKTL